MLLYTGDTIPTLCHQFLSLSLSISFPILITQAVLAQVEQDIVWHEECSCTSMYIPCWECKLHAASLHKEAGRCNTNTYQEEVDTGKMDVVRGRKGEQ